MPDITSRQHPIAQSFRAAARGDSDVALLDGWHLLHEAARAQLVLTVVAVSDTPRTNADAALLEDLASRCDVFTVSTAVMDVISPVRTPAGVVALARPYRPTFQQLLSPAPALVVVAVDVQDPGNAGAIVRSAEAGGATGVLLAGASANPWNWKALRAAMGSTFRLPVLRATDTGDACQQLREAGLALIATVPTGGQIIDEADLRQPVALILGSEGAGLSAPLLSRADARVTIPMTPPVESLNVAVSAALLVYEARRQRTKA